MFKDRELLHGCKERFTTPDTFFFFRTEKHLARFESKDGKYKIHGTLVYSVYSQEWLIFMASLYVNIPSTSIN